jgi:hypothetical protein
MARSRLGRLLIATLTAFLVVGGIALLVPGQYLNPPQPRAILPGPFAVGNDSVPFCFSPSGSRIAAISGWTHSPAGLIPFPIRATACPGFREYPPPRALFHHFNGFAVPCLHPAIEES